MALALLGILTQLPSRYYPGQLCGQRRRPGGLAGWIIDQVLGREADVDESVAKEETAWLCRLGHVRITPTRRLEAEEAGAGIWHRRRV